MTKIEPPQVNFEAIKDDTLEKSELDKLLENIQKERLKDIKTPILNPIPNPIPNPNVQSPIVKKHDSLEVVDLTKFEKETEQEPIKKKKIETIEELLYTSQSIPEKKDTQSVLLSIEEKITLLMANQEKILEKLDLL